VPISHLLTGSIATEPQLNTPILPGQTSEPVVVGGVQGLPS
jgi:hypothetical protein